MVLTAFYNEEAVSLLDSQFRDYPILASQIVQDQGARTVIVPFLAPNWTFPTPLREIFVGSALESIVWLLEVHSVDSMSIRHSESTELTEFELGSIRLIPPSTIRIEAHFILTVLIEYSELNVRFYKTGGGMPGLSKHS